MSLSRIISIIAALVILGALVALAYFGSKLLVIQQPSSPAKAEAAKLLPADTLLLAHIPNGTELGANYRASKLHEMLSTKDAETIGQLLSGTLLKSVKSVGGLPSDSVAGEVIKSAQEFAPLLSGEAFIAVTDFDTDKGTVDLVAGLNPTLDASLRNHIEKIRSLLEQRKDLRLESGEGNYKGVAYQYIDIFSKTTLPVLPVPAADADVEPLTETVPTPTRLCYVAIKGWELTSIGEPALHAVLDRLQPAEEPLGSLAQSSRYQQAMKELGPDQEAVVYLDAAVVLGDRLMKLIPPQVVAEDDSIKLLKAYHSLAGGMRFRDGLIENRWAGPLVADLAEGVTGLYPKRGNSLESYSSAETVVCFFAGLNPEKIAKQLNKELDAAQDQAEQRQAAMTKAFEEAQKAATEEMTETAATPEAAEAGATAAEASEGETSSAMGQTEAQAKAAALANAEIRELINKLKAVVGSEIGGVLDWANAASSLQGGVFVTLRDGTEIAALIEPLLIEQGWVSVDLNGLEAWQMPAGENASPAFSWLRPTVVIEPNLAGVYLNETSAAYFAGADSHTTYAALPSFQQLKLDVSADDSTLVFIDMARALRQTYERFRPTLQMMAMFSKDYNSLEIPAELTLLEPLGAYASATRFRNNVMEYTAVSTVGEISAPIGLAAGVAALSFISQSPLDQPANAISSSMQAPPASGNAAPPMPSSPTPQDADAASGTSPDADAPSQ